MRNGWTVRDSLAVHDRRRRVSCSSSGSREANSRWRRTRTSGCAAAGSAIAARATWRAAGPVVTQETGFSNILPTGEGLFAFSTFEEIEDALDRIDQDYARHSTAASRIARE
mgnify:CR=1 FL=1